MNNERVKLFSGPHCQPWLVQLLGPCSLHIKENFLSIVTIAFQHWKDHIRSHSGRFTIVSPVALLMLHFPQSGTKPPSSSPHVFHR